MTDLFLSYKAEDRSRVAPLVQALEADGYSVWWDADIAGGEEWRETICRYLDAARCVIVVWSKRSVGSQGNFVRDEATRALRRGVYLPVRIDNVDPPLGFGETQALNLQSWRGDRTHSKYRELLAAVERKLGPRPNAGAQTKPRGIDRRTAVIGGAGVLAAAGIGSWALLRPSETRADSIAVLPFANLSGDPAQAYFSDGIAEELRSALSRIAGLKVVARTSSEAMRNADAKTAAAELGVFNILTGSVRRSPKMIRITAQLVDGRKGLEQWSEIYDRPAGDALQIQTDIAKKVAEAMSIRLGGADRIRILQGTTSNPEAHDLLLKAEAYVQQNEGREAWERAVGMVDSALALDPNYADAIAARAKMTQVLAGAYASNATEGRRLYREAENIARRAVAIAPQSRRSYSVLASILYEQLHPRAALVQFEKMLSIPGDDADALGSYAIFLGENKRTDEAVATIDRAIGIDPLNPLAYSWKAYILAMGRRYEEAIESTRRVIELAPNRKQPRFRIGYYLMLLGKYREASAAISSWDDGQVTNLAIWATLAARTGRRADAEDILSKMRALGDSGNFQIAQVLAQLGKKDEAIATLESAWKTRDSGLTTILVDPLLDPLRGDPRFEAIVKRLDFPT